MNISPVITSSVGSLRSAMEIVLNPAERGVTPWNHDASSLPPTSRGPSVSGLVHSKATTTSGPTTSSPAVALSTSLVCSVHARGRVRRHSSMITGNPRPPRMMAADTVSTTTGSST